MKLKTLKYLKLGKCGSFNIITRGKQCDDRGCITCGYVKELKAEAVKWVKCSLGYGIGEFESMEDWERIMNWIKHFFNLTEEDLK